jgi:hypothetical protein
MHEVNTRVKEQILNKKFKRILTRLIISFDLGKKDIDDDWNWSSNLANFFIRLHDFLYPCL